MRFSSDPHPGSEVEWADNPISNGFAAASKKLVPNWCQSEDHWTAKLTQYLFTDCPCCLLFRGIVLGMLIMLSFVIIVGSIFAIQHAYT